jgi:hypothetical protein
VDAIGPGKDTDDVVGSLKLHEAYDILEAMKRIVDEDNGERARTILEAHPQLVIALLQIQVRRPTSNCLLSSLDLFRND